ncbi:hypothetical protein CIW83_04055 [Tissierella sp. P1]|uniref:UvrD-helicase domain-containing protein n=1 Tax=Tissierella sp. P1 TaxID=1280483 RepID=UPI000BA03A1B|nr:UvrD-helicase domain-containing protein [Tissierella sp. P1]OZV13382.1 hypothetical protein CIW83_04055 [Tissierella sp. P1]
MVNKEGLIREEMKKREEIINIFDKNYLLEAGAGAGKTTIIVQRIINHIITSEINPANLVAITFTKAAATELAERIQLKALEYLKGETNPEIIQRLKAVDKIFIGTIHSFCELILREMPFDADITPDYQIIEDAEEFHNEIWYRFLRDREEEYKKIIDLLSKVNIDYKELRSKAILALENPDIRFSGYEDDDYKFEEIEKEFEDIKKDYEYLNIEPFKNNSNLAKLFRFILEEKQSLINYLDSILKEYGKEEFDIEVIFEKVIAKKYWNLDNAYEYKNLIEGIYGIYYKLNAMVYNYCTEFINMAVDYKKERYQGKLTFNELLYRASKLIRESSTARKHFKNKYKYFYIDEFQDTDPMQAELVLHLTDKETEYNGVKRWQDCKPVAGSLFVVGDPKQSIYRFRRADITIYNQVKEIISNNGEVIHLDINFRSSDDICNWVESTFRNKDNISFGFDEYSTDVQAGFTGILSLWNNENLEERTVRGIYKYNYPEKEDQEYVANIVGDILRNYYITEKVRKRKEEIIDGEKDYYNINRKVKEGDIMILTKTNEETGFYLKSLKDRGISAVLAGEKNLGDTREVLNLFILIDSLVDYRDNIKIVSALRNSFYLDLETIELFMENNKNLSQFIFLKNKIDEIKHLSVKKAFTHMNEIVDLSRGLSPIAFIEKVVESQIGVYDIHRQYERLERRDADSALRQTIEILKSKNCGSIYEIREELKNLIRAKVNYELPISKEEAENAVRIMNIHKSKGLEANIVILVGAHKKRTVSSSTHYVQKDENNRSIGFIVYAGSHNILGPKEMERKEKEKLFMEAEVDRILYVAATRGKSVLIIADAIDERSFLYPLSKNINKEIKLENEIETKIKDLMISEEKKRELDITKDSRVIKEISNPSYLKVTPSQFELAGDDVRESGYERRRKIYISPRLRNTRILKPKVMGPRGKIYGSIIHRAIEILINKSNKLNNVSEDIIDYALDISINEGMDNLEINKTNIGLFYSIANNRVEEILNIAIEKGNKGARGIIKRRIYKYARKVLNNFINNEDILELFRNAKKVFPELSFTIAIDEKNEAALNRILSFLFKDETKLAEKGNKTILINGTMDLVIQSENDNWTIIDYKTDICFSKDMDRKLRRDYTSQLEGYKILFEEIMRDKNIKVDNLLFYSTFNDRVIDIYGKVLI